MRPLSIAVHNWISYGPAERLPDGSFKPTINFEAFELACITGPNGHGKSAAAVDALRYALFGKARHSGSRELDQSDLKRKGAEEAAVQLKFEVDDQVYTVTRRIGRRSASAELVLPDGSLLTGVREVDSKLCQILGGLDDNAFLASCVVGQGDATQFMQSSPSERKEILANVLGLSALGERSEAAKKRANQFATEAQSVESQIALLLTQTEGLEEAKAQHGTKEAEISAVKDQLSELTASRKDIEAKRSQLLQARAKVNALSSEAKQHRIKLQELRLERRAKRLSEPERELRSRAQEIGAEYDRLLRAREIEQAFADTKAGIEKNLSRIQELKVAIESQRLALVKEREATLQRGIDEVGAERHLNDALEKVDSLEKEVAALQQAREAVEQNAADVNLLRGGIKQSLEQQRKELGVLHGRLSNLQSQANTGEASCPLCGQELSPEHAKNVEKDLLSSIEIVHGDFASNEHRLSQLTAPEALSAVVENAKRQLAKASADLENARIATHGARNGLSEVRASVTRISELDQQLASESYRNSEREELQRLTSLVQEVYDEAAHTAATTKRQALQVAEQPFRNLSLVQQKDIRRNQLTDLIRDVQRSLRRLRVDISKVGFREDELQETLDQVSQIDQKIEHFDRRRGELDRELATLSANVHQMENIANQLRERRTKHTEYVKQQNLWTGLAEAYGERGLQAFLTRRAIGALEQETNERLRDWTDGQLSAQVSFDQARGLLVVLKDSLGEERKFHACSGGEQFRIALSIRIALSRLMANRIGVKPRILIIDEGFGTQDEEGIDGLERTLKSLVGAFSNIIVITHIESMQKRFDYHITVSKTSSGSVLSQPGS